MAKRTCPQGHSVKDDKALKCPTCGQDLPPVLKKLWYQKWWVWVIGVLLLISIINNLGNKGDRPSQSAEIQPSPVAQVRSSTSQVAATTPMATIEPTEKPKAEGTAVPTVTPEPTKPTATPKPTKTRRPTDTPAPTPMPTNTPTFEETLRTAIEKEKPSQMDSFEHKYTPATDKTGASLSIAYGSKSFWSVKSLLTDCVDSFLKTGAVLYKMDPKLNNLTVQYLGEFTDVYGKKSEEPVLTITVSRKTADKMGWENVDPCNLPVIIDGFELHLSRDVRSAWAEKCD